MIFIKIIERCDTDDWFEHYTYHENFDVEDYETKISESKILSQYFDGDSERVRLSRVTAIDELAYRELKTLKKFNIIN